MNEKIDKQSVVDYVFIKQAGLEFEKHGDFYMFDISDETCILNETAMFLFKNVGSRFTFLDILDVLVDEYDVSKEDATEDLVFMLEDMLDIGVIEICS